MSAPKVCVLRAPGTNCDHETAFAFDSCGAKAKRVHLFRLLENPDLLKEYQILCLPGGFSYGDDVGAGVVYGSQLEHRLADAIHEFLQRDTLTLGICNGFQVLLKSGILPGGVAAWPPKKDHTRTATLTWNANGRYTDLWVNLKVCSSKNVFLKGIETLESPIAHAEGRLTVSDESLLSHWEEQGQIAIRYTTLDGNSNGALLPYPTNPNGSVQNIAGLGDSTGRILGLMPHPERFIHATQHPQWTRRELKGEGAGLQIFRNAVEYFD